ncbi:c-type cytochrome, partial [bacterium]
LLTFARDVGTVARGKDVFDQTCTPCHGPLGGGAIGPNLTDGAWLHGARPEQILATVRDGVADKGMPSWSASLGTDRVQAVTAYVLTLKDTNVPGGKAPQGASGAM